MDHFINFTVYIESSNKSTFLASVMPPVKVSVYSGVVDSFPFILICTLCNHVISPLAFKLHLVIINIKYMLLSVTLLCVCFLQRKLVWK